MNNARRVHYVCLFGCPYCDKCYSVKHTSENERVYKAKERLMITHMCKAHNLTKKEAWNIWNKCEEPLPIDINRSKKDAHSEFTKGEGGIVEWHNRQKQVGKVPDQIFQTIISHYLEN